MSRAQDKIVTVAIHDIAIRNLDEMANRIDTDDLDEQTADERHFEISVIKSALANNILMEICLLAKRFQKRGWFDNHSCADKETSSDMRAMRKCLDAIDLSEHISEASTTGQLDGGRPITLLEGGNGGAIV